MIQLRNSLVRLLEFVLVVIVLMMTFSVLWGVFTRFVLGDPAAWTEEAAKYLLIWLSMLGTAVASARREHLGVDYFVNLLHPDAGRLMAVVVELVVAVFAAAAMIYGGWVLVSETLASGQVTPAMGIKMGHIYLAVPICGAFLVLFSLERVAELLSGEESVPEPPPEASAEADAI
ncbi:2,3-diketo-L-gulonate TRAP transporter small permease protein YiaM [Pseudobythopirellula maris]|uniref:2,3-diketo-L-gulonate TRAP transporter small permease protein YiaM n=1 Tax=Pseudobythopirellula maris TaxID=2527991 RepID=A0A5C5ZJ42_9BACT|nr:TRAP transporter small permease [Pseudobythopirellula maris]TWT87369.1 2,3-diketo-L-gulonate TRAP transporter small permease protein YiaM [Pseudobythopirellula maris]